MSPKTKHLRRWLLYANTATKLCKTGLPFVFHVTSYTAGVCVCVCQSATKLAPASLVFATEQLQRASSVKGETNTYPAVKKAALNLSGL